MYINYNDYELIYLINEGEYSAFKMLFKKYDCLIEIRVKSRYPYGDKGNDLIQEGRMVLYDCIRNYSIDAGVSFYNYFSISLSRKLFKELSLDYYRPSYTFREAMARDTTLGKNLYTAVYKEQYKNDYIAMILFEEYFCGNISLANISEEYNIPYLRLVRKRDRILAYLKKYID